MLVYCTKALDTTLDGGGTERSPPELWERLSVASDVFVQVNASGVVTALILPVTLQTSLEVSTDGANWATVWSTNLPVTHNTLAYGVGSAFDALTGRYARISAFLNDKNTSCRVEVWVAGRAKGAAVGWAARMAAQATRLDHSALLEEAAGQSDSRGCAKTGIETHARERQETTEMQVRLGSVIGSAGARAGARALATRALGLGLARSAIGAPRDFTGAHTLGLPAPLVVGAPADRAPRVARARDQYLSRTEPMRSAFMRSELMRPPRVVREAQVVARTSTVSYGGSRDYPRDIRVNAGAVPSADVLRVTYVDPVTPGAPGETAAHALKSVAVSTSPGPDLGRAVGEPVTLLELSRSADEPLHFYGFECTEVVDEAGLARPIMVAVAESLGGRRTVDYVLVDHDPRTGEPVLKYIEGVPRSVAVASDGHRNVYHRIMPGIAFGQAGAMRRVLMSLVVAGSEPSDVQLVVGWLDISATSATFVETDRSPIVSTGVEPGGRPVVFESVPIAWHPGLVRWIVMTTVGALWEGRFQLVDSSRGRFFRESPGANPQPTTWFPVQPEDSHSGNVVAVHPRTGNVVFQTAHNSVSGTVDARQVFTNQWDGIFVGMGDKPPETFPESGGSVPEIVRDARWYTAPCGFRDWEFQRSGPPPESATGLASVVLARSPDRNPRTSGAKAQVRGRLYEQAFSFATRATGTHRIAHVGAPPVSGHVVVSLAEEGGTIGVGFVEDGFGA